MSFPAAQLRGMLAEHRIEKRHFAAACGLSTTHISQILNERNLPGELARIKLVRGLRAFNLPIPAGLDEEIER